mmetsp:Transcript_19409/g.39901  ORF Transcript_19409/g.39901 Transcript_19409/m.39901 type:complete len:215 (-) Transcript_19409:34-678(-)
MGVGLSNCALPRAAAAAGERGRPQNVSNVLCCGTLFSLSPASFFGSFGSRYFVRCSDPSSLEEASSPKTSSGLSSRYSNSASRLARSGFFPLVGNPLTFNSRLISLAGNDRYSRTRCSIRGSRLFPISEALGLRSSSSFRLVRSRASCAETSNNRVVLVEAVIEIVARVGAMTKASAVDIHRDIIMANNIIRNKLGTARAAWLVKSLLLPLSKR